MRLNADETMRAMSPLEGITVVALEQAVAAPLATRHLADLGARVIKVERPNSGDFARQYDTTVHGMASHFVWLNRSKESLTLDIKEHEGRKVLLTLLAQADIFIHNLAPGAVDRLGLTHEQLCKTYPRLIICEISGYGRGGPYSDSKAYDLLIQCETGLVSITGTEDTPSKVGISIADIASGMYAFTSIQTALMVREKTGRGTFIEISMLEALGEWMGYPYYFSEYGGSEPKRTGASHATIYPYGPFATGDGSAVFFGLQNDREWERFCRIVLQDSRLAENPNYFTNANRSRQSKDIGSIIDRVFKQLTAVEVVERLNEAGIANARLNRVREFAKHPQLMARNRFQEVLIPGGTVQVLRPPGNIDGVHFTMGPVPALGEHTNSVLQELGWSVEDIQILHKNGVI